MRLATIDLLSAAAPSRAPPSSPTRRSSDLCHTKNEHQHDRPPSRDLFALAEIYNWVEQIGDDAANGQGPKHRGHDIEHMADRKSTRLNSSHLVISYAVFCLNKKTTISISTH